MAKQYQWSRPHHGVTHYTPVDRQYGILDAPWCTVTEYSATFSHLRTYKPMPPGMFTSADGEKWYRSERHLKDTEKHFDTLTEAKSAAEKWIRGQG